MSYWEGAKGYEVYEGYWTGDGERGFWTERVVEGLGLRPEGYFWFIKWELFITRLVLLIFVGTWLTLKGIFYFNNSNLFKNYFLLFYRYSLWIRYSYNVKLDMIKWWSLNIFNIFLNNFDFNLICKYNLNIFK